MLKHFLWLVITGILMLLSEDLPAAYEAEDSVVVEEAATPIEHPKKAVCAVCASLGSGHGEEKVAAMRPYEGRWYYFCSEECARKFDADPAGFLPAVLPRPAPAVRVQSLEGKDLSISDYRGTVVLVDFWATWCKPCVKMIPHLEKLQKKYGLRGFTVIGVSIDEDPKAAIRFVTDKEIVYPILFDSGEGSVWKAFGVRAIPATFLIDVNGMIVRQWTGNEIKAGEIEKAVEAIIPHPATGD